jgi:hypothetical protein
MKILLLSTAAAIAGVAHAHPGHGPAAEHWHATDAWGFVALGVAVALMLWLRRGK